MILIMIIFIMCMGEVKTWYNCAFLCKLFWWQAWRERHGLRHRKCRKVSGISPTLHHQTVLVTGLTRTSRTTSLGSSSSYRHFTNITSPNCSGDRPDEDVTDYVTGIIVKLPAFHQHYITKLFWWQAWRGRHGLRHWDHRQVTGISPTLHHQTVLVTGLTRTSRTTSLGSSSSYRHFTNITSPNCSGDRLDEDVMDDGTWYATKMAVKQHFTNRDRMSQAVYKSPSLHYSTIWSIVLVTVRSLWQDD